MRKLFKYGLVFAFGTLLYATFATAIVGEYSTGSWAFGVALGVMCMLAIYEDEHPHGMAAFFGFGPGDLTDDPRIWRVWLGIATAVTVAGGALSWWGAPEISSMLLPYLSLYLAAMLVLFVRPDIIDRFVNRPNATMFSPLD